MGQEHTQSLFWTWNSGGKALVIFFGIERRSGARIPTVGLPTYGGADAETLPPFACKAGDGILAEFGGIGTSLTGGLGNGVKLRARRLANSGDLSPVRGVLGEKGKKVVGDADQEGVGHAEEVREQRSGDLGVGRVMKVRSRSGFGEVSLSEQEQGEVGMRAPDHYHPMVCGCEGNVVGMRLLFVPGESLTQTLEKGHAHDQLGSGGIVTKELKLC